MGAADTFECVLEHLYRAALGDVKWVSAAASINDMIRANGHSMTAVEMGPGGEPEILLSRFFVGAERREDQEQRYYRAYYWRDEAIPRLRRLRGGEMVHKSDLYTDHEKKTSAAYNEFRRVMKTQDGFFMRLEGLDATTVLSFGNSFERGGWGHDQVQAIERLAPHLHQFGRVRRAMANARALGASLTQLLDNRRTGIIQLDRRGRILDANDRARRILLARDGLHDDAGVLTARHQGENARLQRLLGAALSSFRTQGSGSSMKVTRRNSRSPLVLEIHPVRETGTDRWTRQVRTLVLVVDPAARPRVDPDLAARLLGLTPAESRVAVAVASGQTLAGIAHSLGCAESTVKTHLKRVYRKHGIRKQTELVRLVLSLEILEQPSR